VTGADQHRLIISRRKRNNRRVKRILNKGCVVAKIMVDGFLKSKKRGLFKNPSTPKKKIKNFYRIGVFLLDQPFNG
jgi:hypothetical protein